jgi:hypothetical protein
MTVPYPLVRSVRPAVRFKGVRKKAAAFSQETERELRRKLLTGGSATMGRKESAGALVPRRSPPDWYWLQEAA